MTKNKKVKLNIGGTPFSSTENRQTLARALTLFGAVLLLIFAAFFKAQRTVLCLFAVILSSWEIVWGAAREIKLKQFGRYLLITVALITLFSIGRRVESVFVALISAAGFWLYYALRTLAVEDLLFYDRLSLIKARSRQGNRYVYYDIDKLSKDTLIEVFSGEMIAADGVVVSGESTLDYSTLLHGTHTETVQVGDKVFCGALNFGHPVTIRATAAGKQSFVSRLNQLVRSAITRKSTTQVVLSKILPWMTRICVFLAFIFGVLVPLFSTVPWSEALYRACGLLLLGYCGEIGKGIYLAFAVGISALARRGVIFKSCRQVMCLRHITDLIFSKTGTLTERALRVEEVVPHNEYTKEQVLYYAAAAEQVSDHLVAKSILTAAQDISLPTPNHRLVIEGEGVCVEFEGKRVFVGNDHLMHRAGIEVLPYHGNGIVCFVAVEQTYIGCIILHDHLKSNTITAVNGLFSQGIHSIDMVTGDKRNNAENVAAVLGIHRVFAEQSAGEKGKVVSRNVRKGKYGGHIAFVGDATDTECLQAADISFAFSEFKDEMPNNEADIAVISDDPQSVWQSFELSRRLHRLILWLLIITIPIKIALICLCLSTVVPAWIVALTESLVSCLYVFLSLSCKRFD